MKPKKGMTICNFLTTSAVIGMEAENRSDSIFVSDDIQNVDFNFQKTIFKTVDSFAKSAPHHED